MHVFSHVAMYDAVHIMYIMMTCNVIIQFNAAISHKMEDGESIIIDKQICLQL
jgi:hypothetical protein